MAGLMKGTSMLPRILPAMLVPAVVALAPGRARAEEASADVSVSTSDLEAPGDGDDSGAFLVAGKVGGIASFNNLSPFVHFGLDLGYVFGGTGRRLGVYLGTEYTAPKAEGTVEEEDTPARVPEGSYDWELRQKELVFQPTLLYRLSGLSRVVVPFVGVGPRLYLLESVVRGSAGGQTFEDTRETSTKFGVGVPLGAEITLGPGGILAELLLQWGPFDHRTTGETNLGGATIFLGYRALL
jgi:hypothetical protein